MRVAVVLPAYNEQGNLTPLVTSLAGLSLSGSTLGVIVVNDGSRDGTAQELEALAANTSCLTVIHHAKNQGMARALKTGIARACSDGWDALAFMDSDLSHRPEDLVRLVAALEDGADVALGSRFVPGGGMVGVPWWRVVISRTGNLFGRLVLSVPLRDLTTGYRAFRRPVLERIDLGEDGFTIQLESVVKAWAAGFRVVEVPIMLGTRRHGTSSMAYSPKLFRDYWRLLQACRRWVRQAGA